MTEELTPTAVPDQSRAGDTDVPGVPDVPDVPAASGTQDQEPRDPGPEADPDSGPDSGPENDADAPGTGESSSGTSARQQRLELEGEIAADYLEELLEIADLDGDLDMDVEGDRATVSIVGAELPQLVGDEGRVLEALQELTRLAVYRETGERSRLMLDISEHRARRRQELEQLAADRIEEARGAGEPVSLPPMSPFERKVVHDAVATAGLRSESEGAEPRRYVVILPA